MMAAQSGIMKEIETVGGLWKHLEIGSIDWQWIGCEADRRQRD